MCALTIMAWSENMDWTYADVASGSTPKTLASRRFVQPFCFSVPVDTKVLTFSQPYLQWNPDFSNPRFLKTPITQTKSCFPWICFTVILPAIFQTYDFSNQFFASLGDSRNPESTVCFTASFNNVWTLLKQCFMLPSLFLLDVSWNRSSFQWVQKVVSVRCDW